MRFVHIADVHLGAVPDRGFPWSEQRSKEIWDSFQEAVQEVGRRNADLLLIAGDLFHRQPLLRELKEVNYIFSQIPHTKVVLIAGNHDYLKKGSYYQSFPWGENVICLWDQNPQTIYIKEISTYIYGFSYYSQEIRDGLYDTIKPDLSKPGFHILLAHGGDEKHIPLQKNRIASAGFHYVALGHIHRPQILVSNQMAYSGALEPLDRNDTGDHGYIYGECKMNGTSISFVPSAKRSYIQLEIQIQINTTQLSLEDVIKKEIDSHGQQNIYQITLTGFRDPDMQFQTVRMNKIGNIVEILDDTQADYDFEQIRKQYGGSLIGDYVDHFLAKDRTIIENKALYYGLQALLYAK